MLLAILRLSFPNRKHNNNAPNFSNFILCSFRYLSLFYIKPRVNVGIFTILFGMYRVTSIYHPLFCEKDKSSQYRYFSLKTMLDIVLELLISFLFFFAIILEKNLFPKM